jgi:hypothetical protein
MPFHPFPALLASRHALLCRMNAGRRDDSNDLISGGDDLSSRDLVPLHGKGNAVAIVDCLAAFPSTRHRQFFQCDTRKYFSA